MIGTTPPFSDEDLQSFIDGELDAARRQVVLSRLAASAADTARAEILRRQDDALRAAFASVLAEPLPDSLLSRPRSQRVDPPPSVSAVPGGAPAGNDESRAARAHVGIAFAAGFATATVAGLLAARVDPWLLPRLASEIDERFGSPASGEHAAAVSSDQLSDSADVPGPGKGLLIVPNLTGAGLSLVGMRSIPGSPSYPFCFVYVTAAGTEVTLCIDTAEQDQRERRPPVTEVSWQQNGTRYSLAGSIGERDLRFLAERVRTEIDNFSTR